MTKIIPIIIIIFGTSFVVKNGITFYTVLVVVTAILLRWCRVRILLYLVPIPEESILFGIVSSDDVSFYAEQNHSITFATVQLY